MAAQRERDEPKAGLIAVIGVVGVIWLVAIVLGTQALYYEADRAQTQEKIHAVVAAEHQQLRDQQLADLNSYRWIDKERGVAGIPIDRAMELSVREHSGGK
jgi:hypothetical protein